MVSKLPVVSQKGAGGGVTTRPAERVVASPGPSFTEAAGRGAYLPAFKSQTVWIAPGLRELIALTLLAGLGCGLALAHGDLLFVPVFGGAIAMTIETI
jgi:hypothetical protein